MSKFNELLNADQPVLVDFFAEWCGPCKTMSPILKNLAGQVEGKARIVKVDIDKNPAAAAKYNVHSVPTLILFKNGQVKWQASGVIPENQLLQVIRQFS